MMEEQQLKELLQELRKAANEVLAVHSGLVNDSEAEWYEEVWQKYNEVLNRVRKALNGIDPVPDGLEIPPEAMD